MGYTVVNMVYPMYKEGMLCVKLLNFLINFQGKFFKLFIIIQLWIIQHL